jgi:hypothetical protein
MTSSRHAIVGPLKGSRDVRRPRPGAFPSKLMTVVLTATAALIASPAYPEIVYVDVSPDAVVNQAEGNVQRIDLDGDGSYDLRLQHDHFTPNDVKSQFVSEGDPATLIHATYTSPFFRVVKAVDGGATIDSSLFTPTDQDWTTGGKSFAYFSVANSYDVGGTNWCYEGGLVSVRNESLGEGFVALRFSIGGELHHAWARVEIQGGGNENNVGGIVLKDYAWESTPDAPIIAGAEPDPQHSFLLNVSATRLPSGAIDRVSLSFPAASGRSYTIEESADLITWESRESGIPGGEGTIERDYPAAGSMRRFFRVREEHQ